MPSRIVGNLRAGAGLHGANEKESEEKYAPAFVRQDERVPPPVSSQRHQVTGSLQLFERGPSGHEKNGNDHDKDGSGHCAGLTFPRCEAPCQWKNQQSCVIKAMVDGHKTKNDEGAQG
jgi:hypothetical protein